ncbi:FCD domain-containing protein [Chitiniphilus purpureus]|uniref:FCD domain-containing protein n=1 Tax=Chitiniphilus purpureus TaxID=2981137 RepID=A0ABY6DK98_9NEIS|nr:FCD domain-containing protein [Chitiniphilus sp. CD1]UXY14462.1 FCD domain-containing protein [Chitiniphilus sp. CD1]
MAQPLVRPSLVDLAVSALRERIEHGEWPRDSRIPTEPALATLLGVSRNTIREAVRVLACCGVLTVRQGDGTYVASCVDPSAAMGALARASLAEHLETRALLEAASAGLAASRRTEADLIAMQAALAARGEPGGDGARTAFAERDLAFHRSVVVAAHNGPLLALYDFLSQAIRDGVLSALADPTLPDPDQASHAAIVDAIAACDATAAAAAANAIIQPILDQLRRPAPGVDA